MDKRERFRGSLLGLAIGDALGQPYEFKPAGSFPTVKSYQSGGAWGLPAGYWTDDTSMALCLADSLIRLKGMNAKDQIKTYLRWFREGYLRSDPDFEDIGKATETALLTHERTGGFYCGDPDPYAAGNGSLMRLAPVPLVFAYDPKLAMDYAEESSRTTHASPQCLQACRILASLIYKALAGFGKQEVLKLGDLLLSQSALHEDIQALIGTDFQGLTLHQGSRGYVVETLRDALWGFANYDSFEEGVLAVINLGGDTDTNAAVYGQLAGAYYGEDGLPGHLVEGLFQKELISDYADKLYNLHVELKELDR